MEKGLIKDCMTCTFCLKLMDFKESSDNPEKYNWRCLNLLCLHYQTTKSIRVGSSFENFKAPIMEVMNSIYFYATLRQIDVVKQSRRCRSFITKLRRLIIGKISDHFNKFPIRLGGPSVIVQVDETKINFNAKAHKGLDPSTACWALCIVDTAHSPAKGIC